MEETQILYFKKIIIDTINKINNKVKNRDRKISLKDVIYYSSYLIGNNISYSLTNIHLGHKNILDVSDGALIKKRNLIHSKYFKEVNDELLKYIYKNKKNRTLAVDGSRIALLKSLSEYDYRLSRTGNYCSVLISSLIDIENEILINYNLCKHKNERLALREQFEYLQENDILIMDRGYFSYELLYDLHIMKIKPIFRLASNLKIYDTINNCNTDTLIITIKVNNLEIKLRLIKYNIGYEIYCLATTIYDKTVNYFKQSYWGRWKTEINFRSSKYNLSLVELKSKTERKIKQDVYIHNFISIISSYFQHMLEKELYGLNYKLNTKNFLSTTINNLLYYLLYKKATKKMINKFNTLLEMLKKTK